MWSTFQQSCIPWCTLLITLQNLISESIRFSESKQTKHKAAFIQWQAPMQSHAHRCLSFFQLLSLARQRLAGFSIQSLPRCWIRQDHTTSVSKIYLGTAQWVVLFVIVAKIPLDTKAGYLPASWTRTRMFHFPCLHFCPWRHFANLCHDYQGLNSKESDLIVTTVKSISHFFFRMLHNPENDVSMEHFVGV